MILEIDGGHTGIRFSACHFIPRHEKCSRLHGHSYILRLRLDGDIGDDGMVMDFVVLKREMREFVNLLDHKTILPGASKEVTIRQDGESTYVESNGKRYMFPTMDVVILDIPNTTAEEMSKFMVKKIIRDVKFPENVRSVSMGIDEERGQTAWCEERIRCRRRSCSFPADWIPPPRWHRPSRTGTRPSRCRSDMVRGIRGSSIRRRPCAISTK